MNRISVSFVSLLLLVPAASLAGDEKSAGAVAVKSYNVSFLLSAPKDRKAGPLGFLDHGGRGDSQDEREGVDIIELIRSSVDPQSWKLPDRKLAIDEGNLLVASLPATQARVAALLAHLRRQRTQQLRITLERYRGKAAFLARLVATGPVLGPVRTKLLLTEIARKQGDARRVGRQSLLAFSAQWVAFERARRQQFVKDLELEVAQSSRSYDPELGEFRTGETATVRSTLSSDGKSAIVDLRLVSALPVAVHRFAGGPRDMPPLDQPELQIRSIDTAVLAPVGRFVLVAARPAKEGMEWQLVKIEPIQLWSKELPAVEFVGTRRMELFDLRFLLHRRKKPREIELGGKRSTGSATAAIFAEAEPGTEFSTGQLAQFLINRVQEDTWHNTRNRMAFAGQKMIVVQTPAVLAQVRRVLAELEKSRAQMVLCEIDLLDGKDSPLEPGDSVSEQAFGKLAAWRRGSWLVSSLTRSRAQLASTVERLHVTDYDVEIAQGSEGPDPEVARLRGGTVLELEPRLVGSGGGVAGRLRLRRVEAGLKSRQLRAAFTRRVRPSFFLDMPWTRIEEVAPLQLQLVTRRERPLDIELVLPEGQRIVAHAAEEPEAELLLWRMVWARSAR